MLYRQAQLEVNRLHHVNPFFSLHRSLTGALKVVGLQHPRDGSQDPEGTDLTVEAIMSALSASLESYQQDVHELQVHDDEDGECGSPSLQESLMKERQRGEELQLKVRV